MRRSILIAIPLLVLLLFLPDTHAQGIGLVLDNKNIEFNDSTGFPFIDAQSRTLVPFRVVLEKFGSTVRWDPTEQIAEATKDGITVRVPIGKPYILVNGVKKANDTAAQVTDGRTYLPIRAVLEAFGAAVSWNPSSQSVIVSSPEKWVAAKPAEGIQIVDGVQIVVGEVGSGTYPAIVVQKGVPVRFNLHADARNINGCNGTVVIPAFKIQKKLQAGDNIIEFTPERAGTIGYACWMGMIRSKITVVD